MDISSKSVSVNRLSTIPNIVRARFDNLLSADECYTGSPTYCGSCQAILTSISELNDAPNGYKSWKCEYCTHENKVKVFEEDIPDVKRNPETVYLLDTTPASTSMSKKIDRSEMINSKIIGQSNYVVFCIDTSLSMTFPVKITDELTKSSITKSRSELSRDNPNTKLASQNSKHPNHISRLNTVQMAICENLAEIEKESPLKQVGLVTFNGKVKVIGDGLSEAKPELGDDILDDKSKIEQISERLPFFDSISKSKNKLKQEVLNLEPSLGTALGPGLLLSVLIAGRKKGSKVILCTDGLANKGLGQLGNEVSEETRQFYEEIIELANTKGVSVSIITIEGTDCKVSLLGKVTDKTSGSVEVVNPANLKQEFRSMLTKNIIATNVKAGIIFPKEIYIKNYQDINNKESKLTRDIGNVTKDSELAFQFEFRNKSAIDITKTKYLPIQLQVEYVALDGSKQLKVITKIVNLTNDDKLVEENIDRNIVASYGMKSKMELIENGLPTNELDNLLENVPKFNPSVNDNFSKKAYEHKKGELDSLQKISELSIASSLGKSSMVKKIEPLRGNENVDDISASKIIRIKNSRAEDFVDNK